MFPPVLPVLFAVKGAGAHRRLSVLGVLRVKGAGEMSALLARSTAVTGLSLGATAAALRRRR